MKFDAIPKTENKENKSAIFEIAIPEILQKYNFILEKQINDNIQDEAKKVLNNLQYLENSFSNQNISESEKILLKEIISYLNKILETMTFPIAFKHEFPDHNLFRQWRNSLENQQEKDLIENQRIRINIFGSWITVLETVEFFIKNQEKKEGLRNTLLKNILENIKKHNSDYQTILFSFNLDEESLKNSKLNFSQKYNILNFEEKVLFVHSISQIFLEFIENCLNNKN